MNDVPKAYAINAAEGVVVHVDDSSDDEKFNLTVLKPGKGPETEAEAEAAKEDSVAPAEEIERHEGVTAETLGDVKSEHFTVEFVEPPTAEAE